MSARESIISDWKAIIHFFESSPHLENIVEWRPSDEIRSDTLYLVAPRYKFEASKKLCEFIAFRYID